LGPAPQATFFSGRNGPGGSDFRHLFGGFSGLAGSGGGLAQPYAKQLVNPAQEANKPVVIDIYATYRTPCRELEKVTFNHPGPVIVFAKRASCKNLNSCHAEGAKRPKNLDKVL